jgi:hypothetical protein
MSNILNDTNIVVAKKRGRKSKKEIELALNKKLEELALNKKLENSLENINVIIEETTNNNENNESTIDKLLFENDESTIDKLLFETETKNELKEDSIIISNIIEDTKPVAKKRGRKPKGGKIIQQLAPLNTNKDPKPNIILHLKCSLKDLQSTTLLGSELSSFNFPNTPQLSYDNITGESHMFNQSTDIINTNPKFMEEEQEQDYDNKSAVKSNDIKEVWKKLKVLEHNLHMNNICDKKSSCFWCTYDFDNPPIYIPKFFIKNSYHVYGCFCSPECATAYLMEENIDSSSKFERYHLINHIYSKIYNYNKNIKPAPNPYYMLDKYYGNLTIQEYRSLLRNERLFLVVDKPLTRILPELHEDNDDFIINNKIIPSNTYQFKRKLQKKQTKNNIVNEKFGLTQ